MTKSNFIYYRKVGYIYQIHNRLIQNFISKNLKYFDQVIKNGLSNFYFNEIEGWKRGIDGYKDFQLKINDYSFQSLYNPKRRGMRIKRDIKTYHAIHFRYVLKDNKEIKIEITKKRNTKRKIIFGIREFEFDMGIKLITERISNLSPYRYKNTNVSFDILNLEIMGLNLDDPKREQYSFDIAPELAALPNNDNATMFSTDKARDSVAFCINRRMNCLNCENMLTDMITTLKDKTNRMLAVSRHPALLARPKIKLDDWDIKISIEPIIKE